MSPIFEHMLGRHHATQATAIQPAAATPPPPTGGHVKLAQLAAAAADSFHQGKGWLDDVEHHRLPDLLAEVARLQSSPIVQALEGVTLGPDAETHIAGIITVLAGTPHQQSPMANPEAGQAAGSAA